MTHNHTSGDESYMATIVVRNTKSGPRFLAQIIRRAANYGESKTFPTRREAERWAKKRERELDDAITNGNELTTRRVELATLGYAIDKYISDTHRPIGRTKTQVLNTIRKEYDIAGMRCELVKSKDIVSFAIELSNRPGLSSPSTVLNYLSHLSAVFAIARPAWGIPLEIREMNDAIKVCHALGYVAKSRRRTRRPTLVELDQLLTRFEAKHNFRPDSCPMHVIVVFALFSTRRQEEISRLLWSDYEPDNRRILVRAMKHPGDKQNNDTWVDLPDPCCTIIESMPRTSDRIFPYSADAISTAFTRACKELNIVDLVFHDLRHEGTSRLFELGLTQPQVGYATGHRSWSSLQRYTHLEIRGDKYAEWHWLPRILDRKKVEEN